MRPLHNRVLAVALVGSLAAQLLVACSWLVPFRTWDENPVVVVDLFGLPSVTDLDGGVTRTLSAITSLSAWNGALADIGVLAVPGLVPPVPIPEGVPMISFQDPLGICRFPCIGATLATFFAQREDKSWRILDADIVTNRYQWKFTSQLEDPLAATCNLEFYVEALMVHEVGHLLGLGHSRFAEDTMLPNLGFCDNSFASTTFRDNACLASLYELRPEENEPPVARFTHSCAGLQCSFDGTGSSDDDGIASYHWTFPGGATAAGSSPSFFMPGYGSRDVTLTVTDTDGATHALTQRIGLQQPPVTPRVGSWYNPERSGNGVGVYVNGDGDYTAFWYTYTPWGTPIWYVSGTGPRFGASWAQTLFKATWNGSAASLTPVGSVRLQFSDNRTAWFSWTLDDQSGGERFEHLFGGSGRTGAWYAPGESGWGLMVDESAGTLVATVTFYVGSQPRWVQGQAPASSNVYVPMTWFTGTGLCPSCTGSGPPGTQPAGSIRVEIANGSATAGSLSTDIDAPTGQQWDRFDLPIALLTQP